ncbi:kinase-like domain-containing protein [Boeremia exigua]|uniref:kinase-like domain-containing protein n=1 Tax=Boeremia exigua TaxID=749465 RepID=UPI001E8EBDA9|nr:kinase-like domain-containing protein [Boeremia exigua]KAH6632887.1 kinase-like domain-containing protein [Boeremia exigua]
MAGNMRQPIDVEVFTKYVQANIPAISVPLRLKQFSHGQSNPTYEITSATGSKYVLRKKPPGKILSESAHQIEREYRVIKALENTNVPVPKTYGFCADESVLGTPFYIMEFLDGRIFEDAWLPDQTPEERTLIWKEAVRTLAKLHTVDPSAVGLDDWKRPTRFYSRQVKALSKVSAAQAQVRNTSTGREVGKLPYLDDLVSFFANESSQPTERKALVHGDYKLDNLVFHKTEARVIGILDWEMATEGHPTSDLINLTASFNWSAMQVPMLIEQTLTDELKEVQEKFRQGNVPGIPSLAECYAWYGDGVGWNPESGADWAVAFNLFRTAVIMQGITARQAQGQASGIKAARFALQTMPYALWSRTSVESIKRKGLDVRGKL